MANNCTVLLMQQNQDGTIQAEVFHWANRPEGETIPPNRDIRDFLARTKPVENKFTLNLKKPMPTRASASAAFTAFLNANYTDTPAS